MTFPHCERKARSYDRDCKRCTARHIASGPIAARARRKRYAVDEYNDLLVKALARYGITLGEYKELIK